MDEHVAELVVEEERERSVVLLPMLAAALILALIGVIGAIGKSSTTVEDPLALLSAAPDAAAEAGTARMVMKMTGDAEGMPLEIDVEGLVDFRNGRSSASMDLFGREFEMRMIDGVMYMRIEGMSDEMPGIDAEWIGVPIPGMPSGNPMTGASSAQGFLDAMRGVVGEIEELGTETINGQEATGYRVTTDFDAALEELPADQRAELEAIADQVPDGLKRVPMEVWLNGDGLPVRQVMEIHQGSSEMRIQSDLTDFGIDVEIEVPTDVHMFEDVLELQQLSGAGTAS